MNKYPNLSELIKYYPCHESTVCDHAEIEPELLQAVLNGDGALMPVEAVRLSKLYGCPVGVLICPKTIMLDMGRMKHKKMVSGVDGLYMRLKCMAGGGNKKAEKYLQWAGREHQQFLGAVHEDRLSYGHYLGAKEKFSQYVGFATPKPKRRGVGQYVGKN